VKRLFDWTLGLPAALLSAPVVLVAITLVWLEDRRWPFFLGERIGRDGRPFRIFKVRTMRVNADRTGVHSTQRADPRLLRVGPAIRALKIDELPQFWNVLRGDMSLVGPRPNVAPEVAMYTDAERGLLRVRPGVTDFASIVFADLAEILHGASDANREYNRRVRPWKSRLGLHYIGNRAVWLDIAVLALTAIGYVSPRIARAGVATILRRSGADPALVDVVRRQGPVPEAPPPGASIADWDKATSYR
jgi:lipopolysaccharide/colanic/teichoic acid biosynthesis glycosyltransferase